MAEGNLAGLGVLVEAGGGGRRSIEDLTTHRDEFDGYDCSFNVPTIAD